MSLHMYSVLVYIIMCSYLLFIIYSCLYVASFLPFSHIYLGINIPKKTSKNNKIYKRKLINITDGHELQSIPVSSKQSTMLGKWNAITQRNVISSPRLYPPSNRSNQIIPMLLLVLSQMGVRTPCLWYSA